MRLRYLSSLLTILLSLSLLMIARPLHAFATEDLSLVKQSALDFANQQLPVAEEGNQRSLKIGYLDKRLRLKRCDKPLESFLPTGRNILTTNIIGVRCDGTHRWSIYVPIKIALFRPIVVAKRPIGRNEPLSANNVGLKSVNVRHIRGDYFQETKPVIGKVATRPIRPNNPITQKLIKLPTLVKRGESLIITAKHGSLHVSMMGKALMDGAKGDVIRIKNQSSKRIVEGRVTQPGRAEIQL